MAIPLLLTLAACLIIIFPLIWVVLASFQVAGPGGSTSFSLDNFVVVFTDSRILEATRNTAVVSLSTTIISTVLGVVLAYSCARTNMPGSKAFDTLNLIPFFLSPLVGAIAWVTLLAPRVGLLNYLTFHYITPGKEFFNIYSISGMIWVMVLFFTPYVYVSVIGSLRKMDPSLEEASRVCGAGAFRTAMSITMHLIMPSILFVFSLVLIMSAGMFNVPATLGVPVNIETFSTQIYEVVRRFPGDYNLGSALSSQLLLVIIFVIFLQRYIILPRQFTTVAGKAFRPRIADYGAWKYLFLAINAGYFFLAVVLPLGSLFIVSITPLWRGVISPSSFTLKHYASVLSYDITLRAIKNSLFIAPLAATICVVLSIGISFYIYRTKASGRTLADFITSVPIAVPGIIIGMGTLVGLIKTPLYTTIWIIIFGYTARFIPIGLKNISAVLLNLHKELEESSRVCGASWLTTVRRITVPLLAPGIFAAWVTLFIVFFKELNTSILLVSYGNEVTAMALYWLLNEKTIAVTAAFGVIETVIILLMVMVFRKLLGLGRLEF